MIELLTSDTAIVILAGLGLVATGLSILRDVSAQPRETAMPTLTVVADEVADVEVAA